MHLSKINICGLVNMGNNATKQKEYYNKYLQAQKSGSDTDLDPYEVFGLNKDFEWDELKDSYKRIARLVHPDKGGSEILFNRVTDLFRQLAIEYKSRSIDRPHTELKKEYQEYVSNVKKTPIPDIGTNFIDRFNKAFDENKVDFDESSAGYGHIMAESTGKNREDINIDNLFKGKGKIENQTFNKVFDSVTLMKPPKPQTELTRYQEPDALVLSKKLQFTEIGSGKPDDYTDTTKKGLQYTDYLKAHTTTRLVDPREVQKRKNYRSVEEYQTLRDEETNKSASEAELRWRNELKLKQEQMEAQRLKKVAERDAMIARHHAQVNQLFIK